MIRGRFICFASVSYSLSVNHSEFLLNKSTISKSRYHWVCLQSWYWLWLTVKCLTTNNIIASTVAEGTRQTAGWQTTVKAAERCYGAAAAPFWGAAAWQQVAFIWDAACLQSETNDAATGCEKSCPTFIHCRLLKQHCVIFHHENSTSQNPFSKHIPSWRMNGIPCIPN